MAESGVRQIAELAHVSIGTVDRALHNRPGISVDTRKRVLWIAKQLGYKPNPAARTLSVGRKSFLVGVCIPKESHFFYDQLLDGILSEASHFGYLGVKVLYRPVDHLATNPSQEIRQLLHEKADALIVTPGDPEMIAPLIDEAESQNTCVVCVASDAPLSRRSSVVSVNSDVAGKLAAELMGKCVNPQSRVAIVTGSLQTIDHRTKTESFSLNFPRFCRNGEIGPVIEGHGDEDETFRKCYEMLRKNAGLAGLYVNTANCLPVCRALGAIGFAGTVKLITTDLFEEMVPFFTKGMIFASIYQRAFGQGQRAMRMIIDHLLSSRPFPKAQFLSPAVVMCSNMYLFHALRPQHHRNRLNDSKLSESEIAGLQPVLDEQD